MPALRQLTGRDIQYAADVGWAKIPDVIGFAQRTTLSWDGSGEGSIDVLAVEADVAAGVRIEWFEQAPVPGREPRRVPAPAGARARAFPGKIDRARAARGRKLFAENCAQCHGHYARDGRVLDYDEQVVPIDDLGTDPARAMAATDELRRRAANDPQLTRGYTKFSAHGGLRAAGAHQRVGARAVRPRRAVAEPRRAGDAAGEARDAVRGRATTRRTTSRRVGLATQRAAAAARAAAITCTTPTSRASPSTATRSCPTSAIATPATSSST